MRIRSNILRLRCMSTARAVKNQTDIGMPTPRSLGFDMTFHQGCSVEGVNDSKGRPLAVLAGWMGAKPKHMKTYLKFYHERGIDTISFAVGPWHVLKPASAYQLMEKVLENAQTAPNEGRMAPTGLIFHHFSVGGFLFGQALRAMKDQPQRFTETQRLIRAQIFDSPPDFKGIPRGVSKSMGLGKAVEKSVEFVLSTYLKLTENTAGVDHRAASNVFHDNYLCAPSLWYYSKADPVADWQDCALVVKKWREKGTPVTECVWEDTPHIQHARIDPDRYFGALENFLVEHSVLPMQQQQQQEEEKLQYRENKTSASTESQVEQLKV